MSQSAYDLAILGAGSAGLIAADFALQLGARVALIEHLDGLCAEQVPDQGSEPCG